MVGLGGIAARNQLGYIQANWMQSELTILPLKVDYSGLSVHRTIPERCLGIPGYRPILLLFAAVILVGVALLPVPGSLVDLVERVNPSGHVILEPYSGTVAGLEGLERDLGGSESWQESEPTADAGINSGEDMARKAMIVLGILFIAALLWGSEALPIGGTAILVAVLFYVFRIFSPDEIPKAFLNDAVFFILGILIIAVGVSKTGLDRRIGLFLLSRIKNAKSFAFIFFPVFGVAVGFLSEHALIALLIPIMMGIYKATCTANGVKQDKMLAVFLLLGLVFAANVGGPGSPAAGGRNAIMAGYLASAGLPIGFGEWMKYGLPLVPVLGLVVGVYMYIRCIPKLLVKTINPSEIVRAEVASLPKFGGNEAVVAAILVLLVISWITLSDVIGLGGATLTAVAAMFIFRIIRWHDIQSGVAFDVVALYAAASAIAAGLVATGGGLWLANVIRDLLPSYMIEGNALVVSVSLITVTLTNFMSDGATVSILGPIVLPMAEMGNVSIWKVGLITSFASSFANVLVVGTPNNAIAYAMSKDPETGRRLLSALDFIKYGFPLTILLMLVMWGWALFGYWTLLTWP